jgi:hypothetical protein
VTRTSAAVYAVNWLTAGGLAFIAAGTFAQAWAALRVYKTLLNKLPEAATKAIKDNAKPDWIKKLIIRSLKWMFVPVIGGLMPSILMLQFLGKIISGTQRNLVEISITSKEDPGASAKERAASAAAAKEVAAQVPELIRTAATWAVLFFGALMALIAAVIQLFLAHQL